MATVTRTIRDDHVPAAIPVRLLAKSRAGLRSENEDLGDLERSIERFGLLHPIVVRGTPDSGYEVIAGNRRLSAAKQLGLKTIPAMVVQADDRSAYEMSLIENIQRKMLNPVDEAKAFLNYIRSREADGLGFGSVSELAASIGKSQEYVSNRLSLLRLPEATLRLLVEQKSFTVSHAEGLATIADNTRAVNILSALLSSRRISVRELERAIRMIKGGMEIERAVDLARIESTLIPGQALVQEDENRLLPLMSKSKVMLERVLRYVDNVTNELPERSAARAFWLAKVRSPIHDSIDGVIRSKKQIMRHASGSRARRGRSAVTHAKRRSAGT
ncbi:MAG TPA: ParB/RepB/Spo0J family partition protein [Nitrososphaerales archaeon]|nr:ParB/RepB/Spo0J family partition protein [Nitrososphaerales archaeon]